MIYFGGAFVYFMLFLICKEEIMALRINNNSYITFKSNMLTQNMSIEDIDKLCLKIMTATMMFNSFVWFIIVPIDIFYRIKSSKSSKPN